MDQESGVIYQPGAQGIGPYVQSFLAAGEQVSRLAANVMIVLQKEIADGLQFDSEGRAVWPPHIEVEEHHLDEEQD